MDKAGLGYTGLSNLGNTCYLNSTLQILSNIPELNNYLNKTQNYNECIDKILTIEWLSLYNMMWSTNCIISPNRFVHFVREISLKKESLFSGNDQNDAVEYFYFVIDCIHNSLNNTDNINLKKTECSIIDKAIDLYETSNKSIIHTLFSSFIMINYINQETLQSEFNKVEPSFTIEISIPVTNDPITIENCIEYTFKPENMPDPWFDDKTKTHKRLIKNTKICYLPKVLVIHLKRWNHTLNKNKQIVQYNNKLNLYPYTINNEEDNCEYELFGVINHQGSVLGGHYYTYVKKHVWVCFNDASVTNINNIVNADNYCLFYRKIK